MRFRILLPILVLLLGCGDEKELPPGVDGDTDTDVDSDADTDVDSDGDTDTNTDTDTDTNTDTDTDTALPPILVRSLEIPDLRGGPDPASSADALFERRPADVYIYGHEGSEEDVVEEIRARGKTVHRYMNLLHLHPQSPEWLGTWMAHAWEYCTEHDLFLRGKDGELVIFKWYGGDNPIINWSAMDDDDVENLVSHWADIRGPYFCDQVWPHYFYWMGIGDVPEEDLASYDADAWRRNVVAFVQALDPDWRESVILNGWWFPSDPPVGWDLEPEGFRVLYENADWAERLPILGEIRARWQAHPGSLLGLDAPLGVEAHVEESVADWVENGGYLWFDSSAGGDAAGLFAWAARENALEE